MENDRRSLLVGSVLTAAGINGAQAFGKSAQIHCLFQRELGSKAWSLFAGYDSYEECLEQSQAPSQGGPYEYKIICLGR